MTVDLTSLTTGDIRSPFSRLRALLDGVTPAPLVPIELTIGEPREAMPDFIGGAIAEAVAGFGKYPPIRGTDEVREAIRNWHARRYPKLGALDAQREILLLSGSREGLHFISAIAVGRKLSSWRDVGRSTARPAIAMCNPYYSSYLTGAISVGAEPVFLNSTAASDHLPDLEALASNQDLLARIAALFVASPANPQGAVASAAYIRHALELARRHDFLLCLDECYSEIYTSTPPTGGLEVAAATADRFANLVVFNSLSKRSNVPGLRSGFCAGDPQILEMFAEYRNLCAPTVPLPLQHASSLAWADDAHVAVARRAYSEKFAICDKLLAGRYGYVRPAGGFCVWLDVHQFGGGRDASVTLWQSAAVKVIPGSFLAQPGQDGSNPGDDYIRLALVQPAATIKEALERTISVLR